jgi:hypothetical protein
VRRYPAFIVEGEKKVTGWDVEQLEQLIISAGGIPHPNAI